MQYEYKKTSPLCCVHRRYLSLICACLCRREYVIPPHSVKGVVGCLTHAFWKLAIEPVCHHRLE